ncbi:MAG: hypothetical protein J6R73_05170 [Alistipes sp.]|nr:hypothetical protein [Alistipes sp.]
MKRFFSVCVATLAHLALFAQASDAYQTLDAEHPIILLEQSFHYNGQIIPLNERSILIDGSLSETAIAGRKHIYRTFQEAAKHFVAGNETAPMRVYLAPWVYWIDDPDDPYIRGSKGEYPFGMVVKCPYLHLIGLNPSPGAVVLASQRGQTQGAIGNFTMFDFWGDGMHFENLTMGNFCNIDLHYPLKPELGRKKRNSSITQAHVAYCHGDRITARNVHFLSRLNMCPLAGAKRILFEHCHMESTDDALCSTGVYLHCTLRFFGQKPFYNSDRGGAIFLDCDFYVEHENDRQYFCKAQNPLSLIDCRFHVEGRPLYVGWTHDPAEWLRCYQYNTRLNGQPILVGADKPYNTITLDRLPLLAAYRLKTNDGKVLYNTYNLLAGHDGWDPQGIREEVEQLAAREGRDYAHIATTLQVEPRTATLQTGGEPLTVQATLHRPVNFPLDNRPIHWRVEAGYESCVSLSTREGGSCVVTPTHDKDLPATFQLIASTDEGHEAAVALTVRPSLLAAPTFIEQPSVQLDFPHATVHYRLDLAGRDDQSLITWYRATDQFGRNTVPVAVSREGKPLKRYALTQDDVGYYLVVGVRPAHLRSLVGEEVRIVSARRIRSSDVVQQKFVSTDFLHLPTELQPTVKAGFWTVDCHKPLDTAPYGWSADNTRPAWRHGESINGAVGIGLYQIQKGARLMYTPQKWLKGNMQVVLNCDAAKTAGQGFGSATGQYMDLCIQFDTQALTGYALRLIRTTKYSNAVDFLLVRYDNGVVTPLTEPVSSPCFRTDCTLRIAIEGTRLTANASTTTPLPNETRHLPQQVELQAEVEPLPYGGFALQYTGSCGESAVLLHQLDIEWQ